MPLDPGHAKGRVLAELRAYAAPRDLPYPHDRAAAAAAVRADALHVLVRCTAPAC